jgi:hypothetical protein
MAILVVKTEKNSSAKDAKGREGTRSKEKTNGDRSHFASAAFGFLRAPSRPSRMKL